LVGRASLTGSLSVSEFGSSSIVGIAQVSAIGSIQRNGVSSGIVGVAQVVGDSSAIHFGSTSLPTVPPLFLPRTSLTGVANLYATNTTPTGIVFRRTLGERVMTRQEHKC
jgi:hypothetical protein